MHCKPRTARAQVRCQNARCVRWTRGCWRAGAPILTCQLVVVQSAAVASVKLPIRREDRGQWGDRIIKSRMGCERLRTYAARDRQMRPPGSRRGCGQVCP